GIAVPAGQFKGIGNPYAAPLDMRLISKTSVPDFFYVWDPNLTGSGFGAFQTFSFDGTNYSPTPGGGSYTTTPYNFIQSGLAFFVQGGGSSGTLTFTESAKASAASNNLVFRPTGGIPESMIRTNLYAVQTNGEAAL